MQFKVLTDGIKEVFEFVDGKRRFAGNNGQLLAFAAHHAHGEIRHSMFGATGKLRSQVPNGQRLISANSHSGRFPKMDHPAVRKLVRKIALDEKRGDTDAADRRRSKLQTLIASLEASTKK